MSVLSSITWWSWCRCIFTPAAAQLTWLELSSHQLIWNSVATSWLPPRDLVVYLLGELQHLVLTLPLKISTVGEFEESPLTNLLVQVQVLLKSFVAVTVYL